MRCSSENEIVTNSKPLANLNLNVMNAPHSVDLGNPSITRPRIAEFGPRRLLVVLSFMSIAGGMMKAEEAPVTTSIPIMEIGDKASADYQGDAIGIERTIEGARLRTAIQKRAGTVTHEVLRIGSTETERVRLRMIASAPGQNASLAQISQREAQLFFRKNDHEVLRSPFAIK